MIKAVLRVLDASAARFVGRDSEWEHLKRLFALMLQYKWPIIAAVICMAGYNFFNALPAWYSKDIVDSLRKGKVPDIERFVWVAIAVFLIFAIKGGFFYAHSYLLGSAAQRMVHKLRSQLYTHLQSLSFSFFSNRSSGELIARM